MYSPIGHLKLEKVSLVDGEVREGYPDGLLPADDDTLGPFFDPNEIMTREQLVRHDIQSTQFLQLTLNDYTIHCFIASCIFYCWLKFLSMF